MASTKYTITVIPVIDENLTLLSTSYTRNAQTFNEFSKIEKEIRLVKENIQGRELYIYRNENYLPIFF